MLKKYIDQDRGRDISSRNSPCLVVFVIISMLAAQYRADRFQHLTVNDGLTQNTIHGIVRDDLGFMWFGSEDGLNKYDGYQVWQFRNIPGDSTSIADNFILCLVKDSLGMIWIGTESGQLIKCDPNVDRFTNFGNVTHGFPIRTMISVGNHLWLGTEGGGIVDYSIEKKSSRVFGKSDGGLSDNEIRVLYHDSRDRFWVGTHHGGVTVMTANQDSAWNFHTYSADPKNEKSLSWNEISMITEDRSGIIWIGTIKSLDRLDEEDQTFTHFQIENTTTNPYSANGMIQLKDALFIVSFQNQGLARFNSDTGQFVRIIHYSSDPNSLSYDVVNGIYQDINGIVWIATRGGGVDWFNPNPVFVHYAYNETESNSLANPSVRAILQDDERNLWVASYGGLDGFDKGGKLWHHFDDRDGVLSNKNVYSLAFINPNLWIGTEGGGLYIYNTKTGQFSHFAHAFSSNSGNNY
ncbi:MAG: two-component regulator propeller domain-containing protein, partial [Fidelibacterota bacterium]